MRLRTVGMLLACATWFCNAVPAEAAELLESVNAIRANGCGGRPAAGIPVRAHPALEQSPRRLAEGDRLGPALERAGYEATRSSSINVTGTTEPATLARVLRERYCAQVNDPAFTEIGLFQRGKDSWLVLAQPFSPPDPGNQEAIARDVLRLVNAARAEARRCGRMRFNSAPPLAYSPALSQIALAHARDMAAHGRMGHRGSDGSRPDERVTRAGYAWQFTAENVAAGQPDAAAVVAHWIASPGHCANLMDVKYTEMGAAFAVAPRDRAGIYWAQVFATPR